MYVEECSDEVWVGVKCQSNSEIAGSPRNAFRCSVVCFPVVVELCLVDGPSRVTEIRQTANAIGHKSSSETVGDKLHCRKGNSPDPLLRSLSVC